MNVYSLSGNGIYDVTKTQNHLVCHIGYQIINTSFLNESHKFVTLSGAMLLPVAAPNQVLKIINFTCSI